MNSPQEMIEEIKIRYRLNDPQVFSVMLKVPREEFVLPEDKFEAYSDAALSIGFGQTISQPYTVAFMTHLLNLKGDEKVLEIGAGSGYQAAILSLLAKKVFTIERIKELAGRAKKILKKLGYKNIEVEEGQGEEGWRKEAPFDAILITAGIDKVPKKLLGQLKEGGVVVAPVGIGTDKKMTKFIRRKNQLQKKSYGVFHFVPFIEE